MDSQAPPEDTWDPQGPSKHSRGASKGHLRTVQTSRDQSSPRAVKGTVRALNGSLSVLKGRKGPQDHLSFPRGGSVGPRCCLTDGN